MARATFERQSNAPMKQSRSSLFTLALTLACAANAQEQTAVISINDGMGEDTFVHSSVTSQNSNYSTIPALNIYGWTNSGQLGIKRAFLKFDLSWLPVAAQVVEARLSLYYNPDDALESVSEHSGDNMWVIQRVVGPWEPAIISWNTQPPVTNSNTVNMLATISGSQDFEGINVTTLVQDMLAEGDNGFRLSLVTEQPLRMLILASGEDSDPALHPRLEINYTLHGIGIPEITSGPRFNAFWQADGALRIDLMEELRSATRLELIDALGRTVVTTSVADRSILLDASTIEPGAYSVVLYDADGRSVVRVVRPD
jgi:hypothetical protein